MAMRHDGPLGHLLRSRTRSMRSTHRSPQRVAKRSLPKAAYFPVAARAAFPVRCAPDARQVSSWMELPRALRPPFQAERSTLLWPRWTARTEAQLRSRRPTRPETPPRRRPALLAAQCGRRFRRRGRRRRRVARGPGGPFPTTRPRQLSAAGRSRSRWCFSARRSRAGRRLRGRWQRWTAQLRKTAVPRPVRRRTERRR